MTEPADATVERPGISPRKTASRLVVFLLTDIEGSTRLWQEHRGGMSIAIDRHDALLSHAIREHGGRVLKTRGEGDSFFATFSRASDAVIAASAIQRALSAEAWPDRIAIRVRIAINTGESGSDFRGLAVNRCARLRALAAGGQVLVSQSTQALVRDELPDGLSLLDLGEFPLRDLAAPERVFQLNSVGLPDRFPPIRAVRRGVLPPKWVLAIVLLGAPLPIVAATYQWLSQSSLDAGTLAVNVGVSAAALALLAIPVIGLAGLLEGRGWAVPLAIYGLLATGTAVLLLAGVSVGTGGLSGSAFRPADIVESVYIVALVPMLLVHLAAFEAQARRRPWAKVLISIVAAFWILRYAYGLSLGTLVLWLVWRPSARTPLQSR